jgi:hypothetical protein
MKLSEKLYNEWTREEKVSSFREYIETRIKVLPEFRENWLKQNDFYVKQLDNLNERIEKYDGDEFIVDLLKTTEKQFRSHYEKEIKRFTLEIERLEVQLPQILRLKEVLEKINVEHLELFIDLFLYTALIDWEQSKEQNQQQS